MTANPVRITDTTFRDAHQSLMATRLRIEDMETCRAGDDNETELQDLFMFVYHAAMLTLDGTSCVMLIANHEGLDFIKTHQTFFAVATPAKGGKKKPKEH